MFAVAIGLLWVNPAGRNISVEPLTAHLIINWRFPHGRHRRSTPVGGDINMVCTRCGWIRG